MSVNDTAATGADRRGDAPRAIQDDAPDHRQPRPAVRADRARASPTRAFTAGNETSVATAASVDAAQIARGQGDLPDRPASPATARTCRACSTAARRWSASARRPPTSRCPPAACRPPRTARRCRARSRSSTPEEIDALAAYIQANGGGPVIPEDRPARRRRDRHGRRAVPAELRVLPQLHRPGRRALAGQVRAEPGPGHRHGRSGAPCSAARRTCPSSVTAS